jgi:hypothetical protein
LSRLVRGPKLDLDTVSTVRGSGSVRRRHAGAKMLRTHPLPRTVLTVSKHDALSVKRHLPIPFPSLALVG